MKVGKNNDIEKTLVAFKRNNERTPFGKDD